MSLVGKTRADVVVIVLAVHGPASAREVVERIDPVHWASATRREKDDPEAYISKLGYQTMINFLNSLEGKRVVKDGTHPDGRRRGAYLWRPITAAEREERLAAIRVKLNPTSQEVARLQAISDETGWKLDVAVEQVSTSTGWAPDAPFERTLWMSFGEREAGQVWDSRMELDDVLELLGLVG